jgi:Bacterial transglutaminase-like cysteine proteinase BTLCP
MHPDPAFGESWQNPLSPLASLAYDYNWPLIAKIIPGAYDPIGRKVLRPDQRRKGPNPTFPMGRYLSQSLSVKCDTIRDVRKFLSNCRYVSDKEQFGKDDYWQPPEHFEETKQGDCDDFALWTWRQLLAMGYEARFVVGRKGGRGHAWVTFEEVGRYYVVEPFFWPFQRFPSLSTIRYHPKFSVAWDGSKVSFYAHKDLSRNLRIRQIPLLLADWLLTWSYFWLRFIARIPRALWLRTIRFLKSSQQSTQG